MSATLQEAIQALNTLVSNTEAMDQWIKVRLEDKEVDLMEEMNDYLKRLSIQVSTRSYSYSFIINTQSTTSLTK